MTAALQGRSLTNLKGGSSAASSGSSANKVTRNLRFTGSTASSNAGVVHTNATSDTQSRMTSPNVALERNSSIYGQLAPAVRLLAESAQVAERYSCLIWQPVYNGGGAIQTHQ